MDDQGDDILYCACWADELHVAFDHHERNILTGMAFGVVEPAYYSVCFPFLLCPQPLIEGEVRRSWVLRCLSRCGWRVQRRVPERFGFD